jgi:enoyl-CoA hydratase/carnithine racemase
MEEILSATPTLAREGSVAIVNLGSGENRFSLDSVRAIDHLLDEVERGDFTALVTSAEGKIWSNGFDTPWMAANPDRTPDAIQALEFLLARVLAFPIPTVAAIEGHAYAGGLVYAFAHDVRIMRADRGYLCLPEVTFRAVFTDGMTDLLAAKLTPNVANSALVMGRRFASADALADGLVTEAVAAGQVLPRAVELATALGGDPREAVAAIKRRLYRGALITLGRPTPADLVEAAIARGSSYA